MTQTGKAETILKDLLRAQHNMVDPNGEFSRASSWDREGCVCESKSFVGEWGEY